LLKFSKKRFYKSISEFRGASVIGSLKTKPSATLRSKALHFRHESQEPRVCQARQGLLNMPIAGAGPTAKPSPIKKLSASRGPRVASKRPAHEGSTESYCKRGVRVARRETKKKDYVIQQPLLKMTSEGRRGLWNVLPENWPRVFHEVWCMECMKGWIVDRESLVVPWVSCRQLVRRSTGAPIFKWGQQNSSTR
jgi:hypothetical protein